MNLKNIDLQFDEREHLYMLGGRLLTGTTTILGILDKPFLKPWVAKLTSETIASKWEANRAYSREEIDAICKEAKSAHKNVARDAMDSGKLAHEWIERYIKGEAQEPIADERAQNAVNAFLEWEKSHKVEWLASELMLASPLHTFAGTIDAVAKIDGVLTLVDFKTSNQISDDYNLQLAAYYILLDENLEDGEPRPTQRLILRIPKDGKGFEAKVVESDLKFEIDTFLHLREAYKWTVYMKNNK